MKPLSLLTVCLSGVGGSVRIALNLSAHLAARGHRVRVASLCRPRGLDERLDWVQVAAPFSPAVQEPPIGLAFASELAELEDVDLIHVHYALPHAPAANMARQIAESRGGRRPFVVTLHGTDVAEDGPMRAYAPVVRWALGGAAGVTAPSRDLVLRACELYGLGEDRITHVPNFVDSERFRPPPSPRGGAGLHLVHVSNLRPIKRVHDILHAMPDVPSSVRLTVVGDGPERARLVYLARRLGIEPRVRFLGEREDVAELLASADAFVLPSKRESFGLAALEASSVGLPVLASRSGGIPEVVEDEVSGLLHPPGDVHALRANILRLLEDPALRGRLGAAGRARALDHRPDKVVDAYIDLYRRSLARGEPCESDHPCLDRSLH